MNARTFPLLALASAALVFTLSARRAQAQQAAPSVPARADNSRTQPPEATVNVATEETPIDKFDLAAAMMADSGGLTAEDAGRRALARAPQIAGARAGAASSAEDADIAWAAFLPQVDLMAQYKRINYVNNNVGFGDLSGYFANLPAEFQPDPEFLAASANSGQLFNPPKNNYALSAGARYPISDVFLRAWPAYKGAVGIAQAQATQTEVTEAVVELNARNAFYDYARALAEQAVAAQALRQAEAQSAQIKLFVDAGTVAPVDLMTATARVEEMRGALASAQTRVSITQNNLSTLTGMPVSDIKGLAEPVLDRPEGPKASSEELVRKAFDQRAELRAMRKLVAANDHLHVAQRNSALPQIVVSASDLYAKPNPRYFPPNTKNFKNSWEVAVALAWTPNNSLTGYHAGKKAEAQLSKARADLAAQEDTVRMEVVSAYQSYKAAEAVNAASEARLAAAEEAYRVRLAMYRVGAGVIVDLLQADLTVSQARLARANAAINARAALAALRRAAAVEL